MVTIEQAIGFACNTIPVDDPLRAQRLANVATDVLVSRMVSDETGAQPRTVWGNDEYSFRVEHPAGVVAYYEIEGDTDKLVNVTTPTLEAK